MRSLNISAFINRLDDHLYLWQLKRKSIKSASQITGNIPFHIIFDSSFLVTVIIKKFNAVVSVLFQLANIRFFFWKTIIASPVIHVILDDIPFSIISAISFNKHLVPGI